MSRRGNCWGAARKPQIAWRSYTEGWYWFSVDLTFNELQSLDRPATLPMNGCDIGETTRSNLEVFGPDFLCQATDDGLLTVYNGHEKSIRDRVRAHFTLNNDRTGALGLRHFMLHERTWMLRVFSAPCLESIPEALRSRVEQLMSSKSGRSAVESAWRVSYGWPLLCKQ